jgi:hypothetical protein
MGGFPPLRRPLDNPGHFFPPAFPPGSIRTIAANQLQLLRRDVLRKLGEKVESIEHVEVLLEVLRVRGMKQHPPLERLIVDLFEEDRWSCDVFSQALPRGLIEDPNAVVYAETGMLPVLKVPGEIFV